MPRIFIDTDELRSLAQGLRSDTSGLADLGLDLRRAWTTVDAPVDVIDGLRRQAEDVHRRLLSVAGQITNEAGTVEQEAWLRDAEQLVTTSGWPSFLEVLGEATVLTGALASIIGGLGGVGGFGGGAPVGLPPMLAAMIGGASAGGANSIDGAVALANQISAGGISFSPQLAAIGIPGINDMINQQFAFLNGFGFETADLGGPLPGSGGVAGMGATGSPAAAGFSGVSSLLGGGGFSTFIGQQQDFISQVTAARGMSPLGIPSFDSALSGVLRASSGGTLHTLSGVPLFTLGGSSPLAQAFQTQFDPVKGLVFDGAFPRPIPVSPGMVPSIPTGTFGFFKSPGPSFLF